MLKWAGVLSRRRLFRRFPIKAKISLSDRSKRSPMDWAGTVDLKLLDVRRRSITLILVKPVVGELDMPFLHHTVPSDLCNDAGSGNTDRFRVTVNDRCLRQLKRWYGKTVDQKMVGLNGKIPYRSLHRKIRSLQDVDSVNLERIGDTNAKADKRSRLG